MFMIINKDKIISYIVSISTVTILFIISVVITDKKNEVVPTSTNNIGENKILSNIIYTNEYNVNQVN